MRRRALLLLLLFVGCDRRLEVGKRKGFDNPETLCDVNFPDGVVPCRFSDAPLAYETQCCGGTLWSESCYEGTYCHQPAADGPGICATLEDIATIEKVCIWPYDFPDFQRE